MFYPFVLFLRNHIMKRHLLIALFFVAGLMSGFAQRIGGGLLLGPTFSTMQLSGCDTARMRMDFCGGVRIALIPEHSVFGAEIDVIYSRQGMKTKAGHDEQGHRMHYAERSSYINVPVLLNIYLRRWNEEDESEARMVRLRIGPQVGFCLGGEEVKSIKLPRKTQQEITQWKEDGFNRFDYGITAAVSYWHIEVRYTLGMANVFTGEGTSTNHVVSVTWSDVW